MQSFYWGFLWYAGRKMSDTDAIKIIPQEVKVSCVWKELFDTDLRIRNFEICKGDTTFCCGKPSGKLQKIITG